MKVQDYEAFVKANWFGPKAIEYAAIGLGGEVGEVLNEIKKELRDLGDDRREKIRDELGDTLFYLTRLCRLYNYSLSDIMEANRKKLVARHTNTGLPTRSG